MGAAVLVVTPDLIRDALGLPEGVQILTIQQTPEDAIRRGWRIVLFHNDLPFLVEGAAPRTMTLDEVHALLGDDAEGQAYDAAIREAFAVEMVRRK